MILRKLLTAARNGAEQRAQSAPDRAGRAFYSGKAEGLSAAIALLDRYAGPPGVAMEAGTTGSGKNEQAPTRH